MAKDLLFTAKAYDDGTGGSTSSFPAAEYLTISENSVILEAYLLDITSLFVSLDKTNNAMGMYSNNHKIYQWTLGDTYGGSVCADAQAMFNQIMGDLTT
jgi:hypothetical protein